MPDEGLKETIEAAHPARYEGRPRVVLREAGQGKVQYHPCHGILFGEKVKSHNK